MGIEGHEIDVSRSDGSKAKKRYNCNGLPIHNLATDEVHLHPLVADLFQEKLEEDPDSCRQLLTSLLDAVEDAYNTKYERKLQLLDIANTAGDRLPVSHPMRWQTLKIKARINFDMCLFQTSTNIHREMLDTAQNLTDKLYAYNKLAHIELLSGNWERCGKIAQEGYALVENIPLDEFSMEQGFVYLGLLTRLLQASRDLGDYETAIFYGRKAVALDGRFNEGTRQGGLGWSEYQLSRVLYMHGDLDESERMMKHAISLFQEVNDEWATSFCYEILGQIQMQRGLFDEALAFSQKAQDILLPSIGNMHRDIADNLEWRGNIFRAMGELEKAADCYTQVAAIYHKLNFTKKEENALAALRSVQT